MKAFILIVLSSLPGPNSVVTFQEFTSLDRCQAVAKYLSAQTEVTNAFCMEK